MIAGEDDDQDFGGSKIFQRIVPAIDPGQVKIWSGRTQRQRRVARLLGSNGAKGTGDGSQECQCLLHHQSGPQLQASFQGSRWATSSHSALPAPSVNWFLLGSHFSFSPW